MFIDEVHLYTSNRAAGPWSGADGKAATVGQLITEEIVRIIKTPVRAGGIPMVLATQDVNESIGGLPRAITKVMNSRIGLYLDGAQESNSILGQGKASQGWDCSTDSMMRQGIGILRRSMPQPGEAPLLKAKWDYISTGEADDDVDGDVAALPVGVGDALAELGEDAATMLTEATEMLVVSQFGSASMLQRKLRVGYHQVQTLMTYLQARGVVSAEQNEEGQREVLYRSEELDEALLALTLDPAVDEPRCELPPLLTAVLRHVDGETREFVPSQELYEAVGEDLGLTLTAFGRELTRIGISKVTAPGRGQGRFPAPGRHPRGRRPDRRRRSGVPRDGRRHRRIATHGDGFGPRSSRSARAGTVARIVRATQTV